MCPAGSSTAAAVLCPFIVFHGSFPLLVLPSLLGFPHQFWATPAWGCYLCCFQFSWLLLIALGVLPRVRMDPEHLPSPPSPQLHTDDQPSDHPVPFKVKRWANRVPRAEPPADSFVAPSPKCNQSLIPPQRERWFEGRFSPAYRPQRSIPCMGLGLPPPPIFRSQLQSISLPVGGLAPHVSKSLQ